MAAARPPPSTTAVLVPILVLECVGALGIALRGDQPYEQVGAGLALATALFVAVRRERRAAYVVAGWFLATTVLQVVTSTEPDGWLELASHAARYGVALAVAQPRLAIPILRVAASLTFIGHGLEAIGLRPIFVAYLQHTSELVGQHLSYGGAAIMLRVIGTLDILVALALLRRGARSWPAGYMSVWGTITALARIVYAGPAGIVDALVRAANPGAPLALWLAWRPDARPRAKSSSEVGS